MSDSGPKDADEGNRERDLDSTKPLPPEEKRQRGSALPEEGGRAEDSSSPSEVLSRLAGLRRGTPRYRMKGELKHGGMGAILHVWDDALSRPLAMKVILDRRDPPGDQESPAEEERDLARFLEEAQITGQLDHPGIVPVHELGLDAEGRVFFTMKLVKGRDLKEIFDLVFEEREGWNETRALGVILKACEAMTYAHAKGVVHRDLKPANVMVGDFGEVYVMDWGLVRATGRKDVRDIRLRPEAPPLSSLKTPRRREREESPDSPLLTGDGHVMGTPVYMPPEQARGDVESVGPRADVYSIGAMLYHFLARQMPYVPPGAKMSNRTVLGLVVNGPPAPLTSLRRDLPAELVAIVEKAMERDAARRYASTSELADDLRAYLERRVVKAYETGAVAELKKWVARNKPLAATIGAGVLGLVIGIILVNDARIEASYARLLADESAKEAKRQEEIAKDNAAMAKENESRAEAALAEAQREKDQVLRLSDVQRLKDLEADAEKLWPAHPENVAGIEDWLGRARALADRLDSHRERLAELDDKALPCDDDQRRLDRETHPEAPRLADSREKREAHAKSHHHETAKDEEGSPHQEDCEFLTKTDAEIASLETEVAKRRTWKFGNTEDEWQHGVIAGLVAGIESLTQSDDAWQSLTIAALERRLDFARTIRQRSIDDEKAAWDTAIADIRESDKYGGLPIAPQLGLVPIGQDSESRLFEFWHVQSGERPVRGEDGRIAPHEAMGIVLVLIPGGTFAMGSPEDEQDRKRDEKQHLVTLDPYFISKYEMTQGQWERFAGRNPSGNKPPDKIGAYAMTLLNPVEDVSRDDCAGLLSQLGLSLPTEAQWERAARAGTETAWWTGAERETLRKKVNIADQAAARTGAPWQDIKDWPDLDDGHAAHAPIGSFPANPFGLREVAGNVLEWCRDWYGSYDLGVSPGDGERQVPAPERRDRVCRGGSITRAALYSRSANRYNAPPEARDYSLGVRPAKGVTSE